MQQIVFRRPRQEDLMYGKLGIEIIDWDEVVVVAYYA